MALLSAGAATAVWACLAMPLPPTVAAPSAPASPAASLPSSRAPETLAPRGRGDRDGQGSLLRPCSGRDGAGSAANCGGCCTSNRRRLMEVPSRPHSPPLLLYMGDLAAATATAAVALDDGEVGGVLDAHGRCRSHLFLLCRADHDHGKGKEARRAGRQGGEPRHGGVPDLASGSPDLAILSPDPPPLSLSLCFSVSS
uniref:Uncharacterized protein n=1 Tax=Triticum urartu TaxID=4572 RepID=A0A8R7V3Y0_TRIUA